jgi:hypothetical protein
MQMLGGGSRDSGVGQRWECSFSVGEAGGNKDALKLDCADGCPDPEYTKMCPLVYFKLVKSTRCEFCLSKATKTASNPRKTLHLPMAHTPKAGGGVMGA